MRQPRHLCRLVTFWTGLGTLIGAPMLEIEPAGEGRFRVAWPLAETGWSLEETGDLRTGLSWEAVTTPVETSATEQYVTISAADQQRLFRLRQGSTPLLTVAATTPAAGETGVSITRETVLHLSAPLAADTVLDTSILRAESAGRSILSRAELSSDRRRVSLFYGENLPAGARVQVTFGSPNLRDSSGRLPDLAGIGQPGSTNVLIFQTANTGPLPGTAVVGRVLASEPGPGGTDVPLANVTITLDGLEQTIRTTTAADGSFRLEPVPAGRFFVNVDGRTATTSQWPNGAYYPTIGKGWEAVVGRLDNPAGGTGVIYLPQVISGTLQPVSTSTETQVTFPAAVVQADPRLEGVQITVPPNGLFADNGQRGGLVGLAPVASDRLPEPLPAGLTHALDISIQTSGPQNFSEPVPARFPNLPDPVTGETLPPGAKTALWSFNHDTGQWEMQGPMTVTADGKFVETDAGVGIRQAGWHGTSPGSSGDGGPGGPPPCSPGGLLAEGTSSCAPSGPCDPGEAQRQVRLCFARAAACAMKCFEECGTPSRPESWVDIASMAKDCAEGAQCAKQCTDTGRSCEDQYLPCATGQGANAVRPLSLGRHAEVTDPPVIAEARRLIAEMEQSAALLINLNAVVSKAPSLDQLSPADRELARQIGEQILAFHGGQYPSTYFAAKARNFNQLVMSSEFANDVFPAVSGFYVLEDLGNGLVRRGRTEARGYLNNIILRPNTAYRISLLLGPGLHYFRSEFVSAGAGQPTAIPYGSQQTFSGNDVDGDGIPAEAEFVLGTRPDRADTDNDGISDLEELRNRSNPLDNQPPGNGVIATLDTPGNAVDVAIRESIALVADRQAGVAVVDVSDPFAPALIQQVNTPGDAVAVAIVNDLGVVADGPEGVAIVDLAAPATASIVRQFKPGGDFRAVASSGQRVFAGSTTGTLVTFDLLSGTESARLQLPGNPRIEDLAVEGDILYAWTVGNLHVLTFEAGAPEYRRAIPTSVRNANEFRRTRLRLSPERAYGTYTDGVIVFDRTDPLNPVVLATRATAQRGWKDLVPVAPRLAIAADGQNMVDEEPQDASLYSLGTDRSQLNFVAGFATPGVSQSAVLDRGLAFLADGPAGLQVINFVALDTAGVGPSITLRASFPLDPPTMESGQPAEVLALADDDVYVREVQFYRDGQLFETDRSWPFEFRFVAPVLSAERQNVRLRVRAIDTAGNATETEELVIQLLPDSTPPRVVGSSPAAENVLSIAERVVIRFNEPLDAGTVTPTQVRLESGGADLVLGTADDSVVVATVVYDSTGPAIVVEPNVPLAPGRYRISAANVRDLIGNVMSEPFSAAFWVAPGGPDGDADSDGLTNTQEGLAGTNPFSEDTDGDGWADEVEINDKKDPRDPASVPSMALVSKPPVFVKPVDPAELLANTPRPIVAAPPVIVNRVPDAELAQTGPFVAAPPVAIHRVPTEELDPTGPWIARPPVFLTRRPAEETAPAGPITARPPVSIELSAP